MSDSPDHNLEATVRADITESNQPSLKRGFWKVWARGATPGANEMMLNELIQNKHQSIDPAFRYDQDNVYLAYVNTIQSPGDIQLGLYFNDFQSNYSDWEPIEKVKDETDKNNIKTIFNAYNVYLAGPSSIQYPYYKKGWSADKITTDKTPANIQSVSVCNNWLNIRPSEGENSIGESPVISLEVPEKERDSQKAEINKRSQVYKTYLSTFVKPLTQKDSEEDPIYKREPLFDQYNYQNRDIFVQLIDDTSDDVANAIASLLLLKANSPAYKNTDNSERALFKDISLNLTLKSNYPIFKNTIIRSEGGEYNAKETFGDPKIGFQWYYPTRSTTNPDYIIQFGVPELCCEFLYRKSLDRYPKPFTLDSSTNGVTDPNSIKIDILAQLFRILLYAGANYTQPIEKTDSNRKKYFEYTSEIDKNYDAYRNGVNRRWDRQGWAIDDYWKTAAKEERTYITQYYNSKNKARIVKDIKTLFGDSKVKLSGIDNSLQIPRGLYISLGQNQWAPYYSEDPKVEGLLSEDYKQSRDDERLSDITLELSLDDHVIITELGGPQTSVNILDNPNKNIQKTLSFTFKPYARGYKEDANSIVLAKASVKKAGGGVVDDYSKFHYDNFVRASRDLTKKKDNNFFIYNLKKKDKNNTTTDSKDIYNYVRCIHKDPPNYKREDYQSIATDWVKKKYNIDSSETIGITIGDIFARSKPDYSSTKETIIGNPVSIKLSTSDFVVDHKYEVFYSDNDNKKKIKETRYRNVSLYLVSVLNYHLWKNESSFDILAKAVSYEQHDGETVKVLTDVGPNTNYSILAVPLTDQNAYTELNTWLYKALSVKDISSSSKHIKVTYSSDTNNVYPKRARSTLLKNYEAYSKLSESINSLANNNGIIFEPYQLFKKDSITPGNKYGTAPVNYYYVAIAIDYTKSEITEIEGDSQTTTLESEFKPFEIKFVKQTGEKTYIDLYNLPVDFLDSKNPETPKNPGGSDKVDSEKSEEPKKSEDQYPSYIN